MKGSRTVLALAALLAATSCASTAGSPTLIPPPGSRIEVTQELRAGGGARLLMQYGEIKARRDVAIMEPYCLFVSTRPRSEFGQPLVIGPGTFTVERSYRRLDFTWAAGMEIAELDSSRDMSTIMELSSDTQPGIDRMTCTRWGSRWQDGFLTIAEMRGALGGLVSIRLPGEP